MFSVSVTFRHRRAVERRRRFNINDRIKELGTLLPRNTDRHYELVRDIRQNKVGNGGKITFTSMYSFGREDSWGLGSLSLREGRRECPGRINGYSRTGLTCNAHR